MTRAGAVQSIPAKEGAPMDHEAPVGDPPERAGSLIPPGEWAAETEIAVRTLDDLRLNEQRIIARIAATLNGNGLFMLDPGALFEDIGVRLAPGVAAEWQRAAGPFSRPDRAAYEALRATGRLHETPYVIKGLFGRPRP
jgi:hypothetical protein